MSPSMISNVVPMTHFLHSPSVTTSDQSAADRQIASAVRSSAADDGKGAGSVSAVWTQGEPVVQATSSAKFHL